MLGQVQFPDILRLQKGVEAIADLQEAIRDAFPAFSIEQQIQMAVPPDGEPTISRTTAYRFTNETETWSVLVGPSSLTLEAVAGGRYSSYVEFSTLFRRIWMATNDVLKPSRISRQGLRYVDHIEGDRSAAEWAVWINPDLLGGMAGEVLGSTLGQAVCELIYPQPDGRIIFRHGFAPVGPQNVNGYLLDFDSIHTEKLAPSEIERVMERFDESHDVLYRLFRWCVTERAMEEFRRAVD
jgi:uncharacterized protein (TIGR04255 family)